MWLKLLSAMSQLPSWQLAVPASVLFGIDLLVPDPLPIVDETLLGLVTLWLSRGKS